MWGYCGAGIDKKNKGFTIVSVNPDFTGAEGQNRTADTGIFSSQTYENQVTKSNPQ